ncbi:MAG: N-acetylglucosamine-6-phosphate deacetylase [Paracoccaceae bacterium]
MTEIHGTLPGPHGPRPVRLTLSGDRIAAVADAEPSDALLLPGLIDLHCHGGAGHDVMDGGDAARAIAQAHAAAGTTAMLATTMTDGEDAIVKALSPVPAVMADPGGGAQILGVHLEGPFIDPERLGAQPDRAGHATDAALARFHATAPLRIVTYAPEGDPHGVVPAFARRHGIRAQLGHSGCDYDAAAGAFADGADGVTHLCNAMSGFHHRAPGLVGAALAHAEHAEVIPDLLHLHPGAIRAALRAIPRVHAVSDATRAALAPDGDYTVGTARARRCGNAIRLEDGTLAGSTLTMLDALRNLVTLGLPLHEAALRCATLPANYLRLSDRGRIAPGAVADILVLNADLSLRQVWLRGRLRGA